MGRFGIGGLIIKTIIITFIIFFLRQTYAQEITPEVITTQPKEITPNILDTANRFYEISERSLKIGYSATIDTESAFQTTIGQRNRYIIVSNFSKNKINLIFIGSGKTIFNQPLTSGNYVIFKIEDLNLQFTLHSANETHAQVELKLFEQKIPTNADYFELFDIKVRLTESTIYRPTDLSAITEFTNFGEGPSHVRLTYSVIDSNKKEAFTSINEKVIETNEVITKNFNTLNIPGGDYTLKTTIQYGNNQEATSEESFTLKPVPKSTIMKQPLFFIGIILTALALITLFKKRKTPQTNLHQ